MGNLSVIVKLYAAPGRRSELVDLLRTAFPTVDGEAGTLVYVMHADQADEDVLWFYELYVDDDAMTAHLSSENSQSLGEKLGPLLGDRPPEVNKLTPLGGKGLPI